MKTTIDYSKGRARTVDYISVAEGIAQSYPDPLILGMDSTPHGVQKDAIQNGWDARPSKKAKLAFTFELVKNKHGLFLLMEDNGVGLTGKVWTKKELEKLDAEDVEAPESERWARFESFGFRRESAGGIGSRGQGKFLFIHASKRKEILYETLMSDGTYRLGATKASRTECPMRHWEGKAAEKILAQQTGLSPIKHVGTRVIIVDVQPEVVAAIGTGAFLKAIEETWWRNLDKGRAEITVIAGGSTTKATVPSVFPIPSQGSKGPLRHKGQDLKVWRPDPKKLSLPDGGKFKAFELCYRDDIPIPEELKGVAVLHYGMKVATISPPYLPKDITDGIYGYVEFDESVDEELRKRENQKPNHYDLVWSKRLPHAIRQVIRDQIGEFARTELGQGASQQQKQAQLQSDAEQLAMRELLSACRELGLDFRQPGKVAPPPPPPPPPPRPLGVVFHALQWPTPGSRRVEHGQELAFELLVFNTTAVSYDKCQLAGHVFTVKGGNSVASFVDKTIGLGKDTHNRSEGKFTVKFDPKRFPAGGYVMRAVLRDEQGYELDRQSVHVFVAQDPPLRAPFELVPEDWSGFQDWRNVAHTFAPTPDPKVHYNVKHPRYVDAESSGLVEDLGFYLYALLVQASIEYSLYLAALNSNQYPKIFTSTAIASGEPREVVQDVYRVQSLLMARWK